MRWFNLTGGGSQTETRQYNALGQMTRLTVPGQLDLEYRFSATANDNKAISQKNYISGEELEYQQLRKNTVPGTFWKSRNET